MHRLGMTVGLVFALVVGCNTKESSEDSSSQGPSAKAVAACERFAKGRCAHDTRCGSNLSEQECVADLRIAGLQCERAVGVSSTFDACMAAVDGTSCGPLPSTCRDVIDIGPPLAPAEGTLSPCFVASETIKSCNDYCKSTGLVCAETCRIWEKLPMPAAGVWWMKPGICPGMAEDNGSMQPSCDAPLTPPAVEEDPYGKTEVIFAGEEARCCCAAP